MLPAGRPRRASQESMSRFPNLSGRTSASIPGNPLNTSLLRSSGKDHILPSDPAIGIIKGARSYPVFRNEGSNSNDPVPVAPSQATAPAACPHIFTKAVETISGLFRIDALFAFMLYSLPFRMFKPGKLQRAELLPYFEFLQKIEEAECPEKLNEDHQA